jgi:hypothetical protein
MADHIIMDGDILPDKEPRVVRYGKSVQFPRKLRQWIARSHTLQGHRRPRLQRLFGEPKHQFWRGVAQLQLGRRLHLLPFVGDETLVHAVVVLLNLLHGQPRWVAEQFYVVVGHQRFTVVQPLDVFDGKPRCDALKVGVLVHIDCLYLRLEVYSQRGCEKCRCEAFGT